MAQAAAAEAGELVLGRYRPLSPIGSGGSGSVWLARDETTGRELALKIVSREGKAGSRAEREVEAAARLRHPRCLRALDYDSDEQHVYIAYEYVAGNTMRQALRAGELNDRRAIEACAQILDALDHAHRQGIIHRDVKPANVLLADGESVDVRLVDFGLAQLVEAETLTELGDVPGTLAYISPERLDGRTATAAADIWAVGVILWEALAGWHPFWNGSMFDTARKIEAGAPRLDALRPDLPRALLVAIEQSLHLDPAARPSAASLARALRAAIPQTRTRRARKPTRLKTPTVRLRPARLGSSVVAAVTVAWGTSLFPFYPPRLQIPLALLVGIAGLVAPRFAGAAALLALVLPLGNYSLGLAIVFVVVAALWLLMSWREPSLAFVPAAGPILGLFGALFLLPLLVLPIRSALRRSIGVAVSFLLATVVAGLESNPLPLTGIQPPRGLGIEGSSSATAVAGALTRALIDQPVLLVESLLLALAASLLRYARRRGPWGVTFLAAALIAFGLGPFASVAAFPVIAGAWITAISLSIGLLARNPQPIRESGTRISHAEEP